MLVAMSGYGHQYSHHNSIGQDGSYHPSHSSGLGSFGAPGGPPSYSFDSGLGSFGAHSHASLASDSQQVTMDDIRFLDQLDADEAAQHAREIAHLPQHLRPDHVSQSQQSEYGAANLTDFHFDEPSSLHHAVGRLPNDHDDHHRHISSTSSEMSASQQTDATSALVDDMLLADEFDGDAGGDLSSLTYDMKALPPHACRYCGVHTPASVVKCAVCDKWYVKRPPRR